MSRLIVRVNMKGDGAMKWGILVVLSMSLIGTRVWGNEAKEPDMASDAYEYNETPQTARNLQSDRQYLSLSILPVGDLDWFTWKAYNSATLTITVRSGNLWLALWDATGSTLLAWTSGMGGDQIINYNVTSGTYYAISVFSASMSTHSYTLEISGPATNGFFNATPVTVDDYLVLNESVSAITDIFNGDYDPNGDYITVEPHGSLYGRMETIWDGVVNYVPGTSVAFNHQFTYVLDDGYGGRSKGTV